MPEENNLRECLFGLTVGGSGPSRQGSHRNGCHEVTTYMHPQLGSREQGMLGSTCLLLFTESSIPAHGIASVTELVFLPQLTELKSSVPCMFLSPG